MKKNNGITAIKSMISFNKRSLRKFVNSKPIMDAATTVKRLLKNYEDIEYSSTLLPVDGRLDILLDAKHPEALSKISIPVQSAFLVTCTKEGVNSYKVTWSCSLS